MSTETERLAELVVDLGQRLAQAFGDVVSPEAQRHLRNAQREALTALFLIYEEQVGRRGGSPRTGDAGEVDDEVVGGWPGSMEEAIRGMRAAAGAESSPEADRDPAPPRRVQRRGEGKAARSSRVKKIELD